MRANITFDKDNYVLSVQSNGNGEYEIDDDFDLRYLNCYHLVKGKIVLDEREKNKQLADEEKIILIQKYQKELNDTDYKIIKCYEYQLKGLELPYDIDELHAYRQMLRDKINDLGGKK